MGLFKTKKGKGQGFTFVLHVHTLSPWPTNTGSLCVTYERGSKTGALRRAAAPSSPTAAGFGTVVFEEQFELPATLYGVRLPPPPPPPPPLPPDLPPLCCAQPGCFFAINALTHTTLT